MKSELPINYSIRKIIPLILASGVLISLIYLSSMESSGFPTSIGYVFHGVLITLLIWTGCMTMVKFLWKRYPWEQNPFKHLIYEFLLITIYTLLVALGLYFFETRIGLLHGIKNPVAEIFITLLITYFITSIHEAVFFYKQWKYNFSRSVRLEKANIEANYETLKAQVNPHFIFNSLNSLSSMVDENPDAVKYIQNLSGFLRYLLNTDQKELVSLKEEIEILTNYFDLMRSRFGDNLKMNIEVPETLLELSIPPLTLQMLVENCIKHNIISNDKPLEIRIFNSEDLLIVENRIQPKMDVPKSGHGLKNIIERYSFFTERKPEILETPTHFKVKIPLLNPEK